MTSLLMPLERSESDLVMPDMMMVFARNITRLFVGEI